MPKLSHSLLETLDAIKPYDGADGFMPLLYAQKSPIEGLSARRLAHDIAELRDAGMLELFIHNGVADSFDLTAAGRDYRRNRSLEIMKAVGKFVTQAIAGASGGLVVFIAGKLLGQ